MVARAGRVSRRRLLQAAGAAPVLGLLACTTADPEPPPPPDPDDLLREQAAERERALLQAYDAALLALPALAARLAPLRAEHAEHLLVLLGPPPTDGPSPGASPHPGPTPLPGPTEAPTALAQLAAAERDAAGAHGRDCLAARERDLAAALATLSASEHSHAVALA